MGKLIFSTSGLRGVVNESAPGGLTPELVTEICVGFGSFIGGGKVAVGRDLRLSSEMLYQACTAGLLSAGCEVINLGVCPTPTVLLNVKQLSLAGGIVITASHNPENWNGLKFVSKEGIFLTAEELKEFKQLLKKKNFKRVSHEEIKSILDEPTAIENHIKKILRSEYFRDIQVKKLVVGIDACNGAAQAAVTSLLQALGLTPVHFFGDAEKPGKFPRQPEPSADNLTGLANFVKEKRLDFGIGFDPDGDRVSFVDETGLALGEEATLLLALSFILPKKAGPVVVNLSTTQAVDEIAKRFSVPVYRTKVGEAAVVAKMKEVQGVIGGEGNGGVILPEINFTRDGITATAILIHLLSEQDKPLSQIAQTIPKYYIQKATLSLPAKEFLNKKSKLKKGFAPAQFNTEDGLLIIGKDFRVHIRPSNTEPIIRVIAESRLPDYTLSLITKVKEILTKD
uniref:Phosphoglucosamine mutase n=1 Tax=candidate division WOR-3 bacterium TaxID=2052148 RepID=A0A7C6EC18_UNCW3